MSIRGHKIVECPHPGLARERILVYYRAMAVIKEHSAGGVVFRKGEEGPEILLVSTKGGTRWQLPKGKVEPGESPREAAFREVREEGGVEGELICPLDTISYWYYWEGEKHRKLVDFFLFRYKAGDPSQHDWEVDDAKFFPAQEALKVITFPTERKVVERALEIIRKKHLLD